MSDAFGSGAGTEATLEAVGAARVAVTPRAGVEEDDEAVTEAAEVADLEGAAAGVGVAVLVLGDAFFSMVLLFRGVVICFNDCCADSMTLAVVETDEVVINEAEGLAVACAGAAGVAAAVSSARMLDTAAALAWAAVSC